MVINGSTLDWIANFTTGSTLDNFSSDNINNSAGTDELYVFPKRDPLSWIITMTTLYVLILVTGLIGNVCTCIVITRNKYMHTSTNCYLYSLAMSDLLLLVFGMPQELYQLWNPYPYVFGENFCIIRGLASESSTNVSILIIISFTVERYLAICHPFKAQTTTSVSRAIKIIVFVWLVGILCAAPLAFQFGVVLREHNGKVLEGMADCTLKRPLQHAFEISTFFFFALPMIVISVLYVLIGLRLFKPDNALQEILSSDSSRKTTQKSYRPKFISRQSTRSLRSNSRIAVIKMLLAVVVAFFACWAPFHAQRLLALHSSHVPSDAEIHAYTVLTYISGVTYYVSSTINPILYSIMSVKFRQAFKDTLAAPCCPRWSFARTRSWKRNTSWPSGGEDPKRAPSNKASFSKKENGSNPEELIVFVEKRTEKFFAHIIPQTNVD